MQGKTAMEVCLCTGVNQTLFGKLLSLQVAPITRMGCEPETWQYLPACERIAEHFLLTADMVFPLDTYYSIAKKILEKVHGEVEMVPLEEIADMPTAEQDPYGSLLAREVRDKCFETLDTLTPREKRVIQMRFGLAGNPECTLEEVAERFLVSRSLIQQIQARALRKLRHPSRSTVLMTLLDESPSCAVRSEEEEYFAENERVVSRSDKPYQESSAPLEMPVKNVAA